MNSGRILGGMMFAAIIISCGGSSSERDVSSDATSTPPSNPVATTFSGIPYPLTLPLEDLLRVQIGPPLGWEEGVIYGPIDNRAAAREYDDPDEWLDLFEQSGRSTNFYVEFSKDLAEDRLLYSAEIYRERNVHFEPRRRTFGLRRDRSSRTSG